MVTERDTSPDLESTWDIVVMGGGLAGSATAIELLKLRPETRVLIVDSNESLGRRVGESTVELSSYFLGRVLGLSSELSRNHIAKQGLRFWFANDSTQSLEECSELGPPYHVNFPGYQIDRAQLDEKVLEMAVEHGAVLRRPARVSRCDLNPGGMQSLKLQIEGTTLDLEARWVIDASGSNAFLARRNKWIRQNAKHPISSIWSRWTGVTDWDDPALQQSNPQWANRIYGLRNTATNHLTGLGWWAWLIPLQNGDVSIGVVYDERLVELPEDLDMAERLRFLLNRHPASNRLLRNAEMVPEDIHFRRNCSYSSVQFGGDGFALVGDAAGFLDPLYSPGLDWVCYTVMAGSKLIADALKSGAVASETLTDYNQKFQISYDRWFEAIYADKYYYIGDFELMQFALKLDLGFYYLGVVNRPYTLGNESLRVPPFGQPEGKWPGRFIRFYNRRLATLARNRLKSGRWGCRNAGQYARFTSYRLNWALPARILISLLHLAAFEIYEKGANLFSGKQASHTEG